MHENRTGHDTDNVVLLGDFNAYAMEDPIKYLLDNGYSSTIDLSAVPPPYSYLFDGQFGMLDYIFVKTEAYAEVVVDSSIWHVNADEPDLIDYNLDYGRDASLFVGTVPYRYSDHDPLILNMNLLSTATSEVPTLSPSTIDGISTSSPSLSPSSAPSNEPTNDVGVDTSEMPSSVPSSSPSTTSTGGSLVLIITELADPGNDSSSRYVELYSPNGAGQTIDDELYLLRWTNGNAAPTTSSAISLQGKTIGSDGFFVVCSSATADTSYNNACDLIGGTGGPVDSNGDDQIALVMGDPVISYSIIDLFGVPGEDGTGTNHDFADSRAERKADVLR